MMRHVELSCLHSQSRRQQKKEFVVLLPVASFILLLIYLLYIAVSLVVVVIAKEEDLYKLLGVPRTASTKEIKSAYRRKALDTHPDKNLNKAPDVAAEEFRQIVHAFEILSDESLRKRYDRTGSSTEPNNSYGGGGSNRNRNNNNHGSFQWNFYYNYRPMKLKDKFEVKQAMSRVLHVVSLDQLRTIMLDENDRLERNIVICFTTATLEQHVDDEMVFPYPFAGMSSQGIWWEDLLQTVKIRFHKANELTNYFDISGIEINKQQAPIFVYCKRGMELDGVIYDKIQTNDRSKFEKWMWERIEIRIGFVNKHYNPIEMYWIHGSRAHNKGICQVNETCYHTSMLSHEWYIRDVTIDTHRDSPGRYKLSTESSLGSFKIVNDTPDPQLFVIETLDCMDWSGHCPFYKTHSNECHKNPNFMNEYCAKTCDTCHLNRHQRNAPTSSSNHNKKDEL